MIIVEKNSKGRGAADIIPDPSAVFNNHYYAHLTGKMVNVLEEI